MIQQDFLQALSEKVRGALLISESEYPFTIENFGIITTDSVAQKIAQSSNATIEQVKPLAADAFITKIEKSVDPGDAPIVANFQKIKSLYQFLRENLSGLQAYRVESGVQVPVYLIGSLQNGIIIGVKTISVES